MLVMCVSTRACVYWGWHNSRVVGIEDPIRGCLSGKDLKGKIVEHSSEKKTTS